MNLKQSNLGVFGQDSYKLNLTYLQWMKIFKLFGPGKPKDDPYWGFDKETHFRPKLNKADYYRLTGFDFGWFVLEPITKFIKKNEYEIERGRSLSYPQKTLYYWWYLDGQVKNGGFVQFFYNGYGKYVPTIIKGLEYVGDKKMANLIQRAESIYQKRKKLIDRAQQEDLFGSDLYEKLEELEELDDQYYSIDKLTMSLIEKYIRSNPGEVCVDEEGNEFNIEFSGECKSHYPNGTVKDFFIVENGSINGEFKRFYETGNVQEQVYYKNGQATGEKTEFFENGDKKYSVRFDPETNQFEHLRYYENGNPQKLEHRLPDTDSLIGENKEWYDNGQLEKSIYYNKSHGFDREWLEFYKDGSKKVDAEWKDGKFLLYGCWNDKGEQILKDGTGIHLIEYGSTRVENEYKNYKRHGKLSHYTNGILVLYQEFENGNEHGVTRSFYSDGKIKEETIYENGGAVSYKKFPKFENPRVQVKIRSSICEKCFEDDESGLQPPENNPQPLNAGLLETALEVDKALFEPYGNGDEMTIHYSYSVKTDKQGNVVKINFLVADNLWIEQDILRSLEKLQFEVAYRNNEPTECYYIVQHLLSLTEG